MNERPVILLGAGGHAKVVLDLLNALGQQVIGVCDPGLVAMNEKSWRGVPILGDDSVITQYSTDSVILANGTGSLPGKHLRRRLHQTFTNQGYGFAELVHPTAILGSGLSLGEGTQVMAGVIIQADVCVGDNVILNTGARIDHGCQIGPHVHLAPGAVLSGDVHLEEGVHIGTGAILIQGIRIGRGAVVGAGTTVLKDVPAGHQVTGQPARQPVAMKSGV